MTQIYEAGGMPRHPRAHAFRPDFHPAAVALRRVAHDFEEDLGGEGEATADMWVKESDLQNSLAKK